MSVPLEQQLASQTAVFLSNCKVGDWGTIYGSKDGEAFSFRGEVMDVQHCPGATFQRLFVLFRLPVDEQTNLQQAITVNCLTGSVNYLTVQ